MWYIYRSYEEDADLDNCWERIAIYETWTDALTALVSRIGTVKMVREITELGAKGMILEDEKGTRYCVAGKDSTNKWYWKDYYEEDKNYFDFDDEFNAYYSNRSRARRGYYDPYLDDDPYLGYLQNYHPKIGDFDAWYAFFCKAHLPPVIQYTLHDANSPWYFGFFDNVAKN